MVVKKDSIKSETDEELEARADLSEERETKTRGRPKKKAEEGVKAFVYDGAEHLVVLSVGGTNYDFRKGEPVYLPPGQSVDHPDVHEVEA